MFSEGLFSGSELHPSTKVSVCFLKANEIVDHRIYVTQCEYSWVILLGFVWLCCAGIVERALATQVPEAS